MKGLKPLLEEYIGEINEAKDTQTSIRNTVRFDERAEQAIIEHKQKEAKDKEEQEFIEKLTVNPDEIEKIVCDGDLQLDETQAFRHRMKVKDNKGVPIRPVDTRQREQREKNDKEIAE